MVSLLLQKNVSIQLYKCYGLYFFVPYIIGVKACIGTTLHAEMVILYYNTFLTIGHARTSDTCPDQTVDQKTEKKI